MLVELLILLAAIGGSGSIVAVLAWLWHRVKRLEETGGLGGKDAERIIAELERMRDEVSESQDGVKMLRERLDFLERLLESKQRTNREGTALLAGEPEGDSVTDKPADRSTSRTADD